MPSQYKQVCDEKHENTCHDNKGICAIITAISVLKVFSVLFLFCFCFFLTGHLLIFICLLRLLWGFVLFCFAFVFFYRVFTDYDNFTIFVLHHVIDETDY